MIRRAANKIGDGALGFVVEGLLKKDAEGNETFVYVFESTVSGMTEELAINECHFNDGSPADLEVIE